MSTKNLARTVIEGGRRPHNRWERRQSHGEERARTHALTQQLHAGFDADLAIFPARRQVWRRFDDKLGPARRWLRSQAGRPWNKVRSELFARFDVRTTAGRHIVFCHLLQEVLPPAFNPYRRRELWISSHGILRYEPIPRARRGNERWGYLPEPESVLREWLAGRRVIEQGARLYWLVATPQGGFRQQHELSVVDAQRFRALPVWFREQLQGPIRLPPGPP
jgi:hypothetical protein